MFEFDQQIVDSLLSENIDFKRLYEKHDMLNQQVDEINSGNLTTDDVTLENMKKEKLLLKDRMSVMIEDYKRQHA
ncbi:MAG TPA: YdcH family protein [Gammaproteobacteria bacterium]